MYKALLIIIFLWNALKKSTDTESAPTLLNLGMIKSGHCQFGTTTQVLEMLTILEVKIQQVGTIRKLVGQIIIGIKDYLKVGSSDQHTGIVSGNFEEVLSVMKTS